MNIPIVFEDDWIMVLDKPAGLLVIPTPRKEARTLTSILNDHAASQNKSYRLHPCHRLDRETSGLIIYAKGKGAQQKVMEEFKNRRVEKKYIALVQGRLSPRQGQISSPIEGKNALTAYSTVKEKEKLSVVELYAVTGRTNQLRIHLQRAGHPLVGEAKFARRRESSVKAKRACLHAKSLSLVHPFTGKKIFLDSELPADMKALLGEEGIR